MNLYVAYKTSYYGSFTVYYDPLSDTIYCYSEILLQKQASVA